jgi:hypothetical protein
VRGCPQEREEGQVVEEPPCALPDVPPHVEAELHHRGQVEGHLPDAHPERQVGSQEGDGDLERGEGHGVVERQEASVDPSQDQAADGEVLVQGVPAA